MAATDRRLVRSKSGLRIVSVSEEGRSPLLLQEPLWIPDNQCTNCAQCETKFDFLKRRHHCRRCGQCYCGACCCDMLPLPRMCFVDPVRQCASCAKLSKKEADFFDKHLKVLTTGSLFQVSSSALEMENCPVFLCKLSSCHRFIQFEDPEAPSLDPIDLSLIENIQIQGAGTDSQGNTVATGVMIRYKDSCAEMQETKLVAMDAGNKRQAMMWIAALQRAMKLIYELKRQSSSSSSSSTPGSSPPCSP